VVRQGTNNSPQKTSILSNFMQGLELGWILWNDLSMVIFYYHCVSTLLQKIPLGKSKKAKMGWN
jgi:hypothetical protein